MTGRKKKESLREEDVGSLKLLRPLTRLAELLHADADCPNRIIHHDKLLCLLLLMYFNPVVTSLRDLSELSGLKKVRRKLDIPHFGKSTIAEAMRTFDPNLLVGVAREMSEHVPQLGDERLRGLKQVLTAVDGSLLRALPRMTWALWVDENNRAAKLHVCFEILKGVPSRLDVTEGVASETDFLADNLEADHMYVTDRGYAKYSLFQKIIDAKSSFVARIKANAATETMEERPLTEDDRRAGVISDRIVRLGTDPEAQGLRVPVRIVEVEAKTRSGSTCMLLATDRLDIPAEIIALIYRHRWQVELFFRWLKSTLDFGHLISDSRTGVAIQVYAAIIATLLIAIISGRKPNKRTFVLTSFYMQGLADEEELTAFLATQRRAAIQQG
jgi:hypothetical protein